MRGKMMMAAAVLLAAGAGAAQAQQRVSETRGTTATGSVEVHVADGQVRVVGWDRNEVQVTGTLANSSDRLELESDAGTVVVRVGRNYANGTRHSENTADLEIRVPERNSVEVQVVSADASVTGVNGPTEVNAVSGSVRVSGGHAREVTAVSRSGEVQVTADADRVEATSISGSVTVDGTVRERVEATSVSGEVSVGAAAGEVEAGSVSGAVTVRSMRGHAELHSVSGDIRVSGAQLSGSAQTVSGTITLTGELERGGNLELTSHSGDVVLQLAPNASAELQVGTFSGEIEADYPGARVTRVSRREARVQLGGGDVHVEVHTFSGNVKLSAR